MNREDIIRMAREASTCLPDVLIDNDDVVILYLDELERFAALVADAEAKRIHNEGMVTVGYMREQILAEREACARICDAEAIDEYESEPWTGCAQYLSNNIRARS
jgi:hypothetical protein